MTGKKKATWNFDEKNKEKEEKRNQAQSNDAALAAAEKRLGIVEEEKHRSTSKPKPYPIGNAFFNSISLSLIPDTLTPSLRRQENAMLKSRITELESALEKEKEKNKKLIAHDGRISGNVEKRGSPSVQKPVSASCEKGTGKIQCVFVLDLDHTIVGDVGDLQYRFGLTGLQP